MTWPATAADLILEQRDLARARPEPWQPPSGRRPIVGGSFVCFARGEADGPGQQGDRGWAGAALVRGEELLASAAAAGEAGAAYESGLLALREGPLLEDAVRRLPQPPECLLVNATGRDHPRRAGLALHLGAILDVPTVGVTHRPLLAQGAWPRDEKEETSPLLLDDEVVAYWLRTRRGMRPLAVHDGWRTDPETAVKLVVATLAHVRTPEPLRHARRVAREARARGASATPRECATRGTFGCA
jgi:deoxyribonuclease V